MRKSNAALKVVHQNAQPSAPEPRLPDDDGEGGDDDDPLYKADRIRILEAAASCYSAACMSQTAPNPPFEHPIALAKQMLAFVEGD